MDKESVGYLLGREENVPSLSACAETYAGATVLITGGGGFIGSEICRKCRELSPKLIVVFDMYENCAYELSHGSGGKIKVEIGSVRDDRRIDALFDKYRPQTVIHAAAHKHVPLMEDAPAEAIKNNIFGSENLINASMRYRAERFMLISTDKATDPVSVMGATKRFAELIALTRESGTAFSAVRFGNVLGSSGSVLPIFEKQIANGGPVTLTDGSDTRYFMTASEAASLVLAATLMPAGLYIMDAGEPVNMRVFAERLIRLHGLEPYRDIEITETGRRPGDRQNERLFPETDFFEATPVPPIFRMISPLPSRREIDARLAKLHALSSDWEGDEAKEMVKRELFDAVRGSDRAI